MGKGAEWHNTQFCGLRSTRATRQGRWKPITKGRKNSMPATPTLTPLRASTTSISSSRREAITISFKTVFNRRGCRTRKDSPRFVDTLITVSLEFFKRKSPKEIQVSSSPGNPKPLKPPLTVSTRLTPKRRGSLPAEKVVSPDGKLLRGIEKVQGYDQRPVSRK